MKIVVVLFCAAIKESGFPVTPLLDVLMELRFVRVGKAKGGIWFFFLQRKLSTIINDTMGDEIQGNSSA